MKMKFYVVPDHMHSLGNLLYYDSISINDKIAIVKSLKELCQIHKIHENDIITDNDFFDIFLMPEDLKQEILNKGTK
jgi:hypothetical protein